MNQLQTEARLTQRQDASWENVRELCLFDTLFRTIGRLKPEWIVCELFGQGARGQK